MTKTGSLRVCFNLTAEDSSALPQPPTSGPKPRNMRYANYWIPANSMWASLNSAADNGADAPKCRIEPSMNARLGDSGDMKMSPINKEWHELNRMPKNASSDQRIAWHLEHSKQCACRPIPKGVLALIQSKASSNT